MTQDSSTSGTTTSQHTDSAPDRRGVSHKTLMATTWLQDPTPIPGLVEGYANALFSAPGAGKTWLLQQMAYHIAGVKRLGSFDVPEARGRALLLLMEDSEWLTQNRADAVETGDEASVAYRWGLEWDVSSLEAELLLAEAEGNPFTWVGVDHFSLFAGSRSSKDRTDEHEEREWTKIKKLAERYSIAISVLGHSNKSGQYSGSTKMLGTLGSAFFIEKGKEPGEGILECIKMRYSEMVDYPLTRNPRGAWEFGGTTLAQASSTGLQRDILGIIEKITAASSADLQTHPALSGYSRGSIRTALSRLWKKGDLERKGAKYVMYLTPGDEKANAPTCKGCKDPMTKGDLAGNGYHVSCDPRNAQPAPLYQRPADSLFFGEPTDEEDPLLTDPPEEDPSYNWPVQDEVRAKTDEPSIPAPAKGKETPADGKFWYYDALYKSVNAPGRKGNPLIVYPEGSRGEGSPFPLMSCPGGGGPQGIGMGRLACHHHHTAAGWRARHSKNLLTVTPPTQYEGILVAGDRNGSYFSGLSSVKVCANKLHHTGPMESYNRLDAGIYQVITPAWEESDMPHPMGTNSQVGQTTLVTAPTLEWLTKLADAGRMERPRITDSWTGRANSQLFRPVYDDYKIMREESFTMDSEEYKVRKGDYVRMLQSLCTNGKSQFWRPDWLAAIQAEAFKRLWIGADKAVRETGAKLIFIGVNDVAAFLTPDGQLPATYTLGNGLGEFKTLRTEIEES